MRKNYANISCAKLLQLIGLQPSAKRKYIDADVAFEEGFFLSAPIRLYVLLHFYADTRSGIVNRVPAKELCDTLKIHPKTLSSALMRLADSGFIGFGGYYVDDCFLTAYLVDYKDMFLPMGRGGKGYVCVNDLLLERIVNTRQVNELRILIRVLLESLEAERRSASKRANADLTYAQIRKGLPHYLKPCLINAALENLSDVFWGFSCMRKHFVVTLNDLFNGRLGKLNERAFAESVLRNEIDEINDLGRRAYFSILNFSENGILGFDVQEKFLEKGIRFPLQKYTRSLGLKLHIPELVLSEADIKDCVLVAQDCGTTTTIKALREFFGSYILDGLRKNLKGKLNVGGLIRKIAMEINACDAAFSTP